MGELADRITESHPDIDSYPIIAGGKIQKYKLHETAIEMLGLQDITKIETA
ncbi:MAG: hypothetical protein PHY77_07940 [Desulfotomaculaceae bacterium]|nr:hypothetical protein [Desulfotomaculaceae bacterium]